MATVAEYNARHAGKAWAIIALAYPSSRLACAYCAGMEDQEAGRPVFGSDEYEGLTCDLCGVDL